VAIQPTEANAVSGLAEALRENCGYLRDEGWHSMAILVEHAADELDRLQTRVAELEERFLERKTPRERLRHSIQKGRLRQKRLWSRPREK
jgi:hypothetical protein